jgi:hypothetical protein
MSPSKEKQSKSIGSRAPPKKQKNTREARPTKPKYKAGDYDTPATSWPHMLLGWLD